MVHGRRGRSRDDSVGIQDSGTRMGFGAIFITALDSLFARLITQN